MGARRQSASDQTKTSAIDLPIKRVSSRASVRCEGFDIGVMAYEMDPFLEKAFHRGNRLPYPTFRLWAGTDFGTVIGSALPTMTTVFSLVWNYFTSNSCGQSANTALTTSPIGVSLNRFETMKSALADHERPPPWCQSHCSIHCYRSRDRPVFRALGMAAWHTKHLAPTGHCEPCSVLMALCPGQGGL